MVWSIADAGTGSWVVHSYSRRLAAATSITIASALVAVASTLAAAASLARRNYIEAAGRTSTWLEVQPDHPQAFLVRVVAVHLELQHDFPNPDGQLGHLQDSSCCSILLICSLGRSLCSWTIRKHRVSSFLSCYNFPYF